MTRPKQHAPPPKVSYPHLRPTQPHQLIQSDIVPKHLLGGTRIACFNAIDVVSRYPSSRQYTRRTARNAVAFLWEVWQEQGLPDYHQVDNESCFSGGYTHPAVLGRVVRLALLMGVQLVFSPYYHPKS
ncbi:transposase, partial [Candidatus Parcubacteria bacterium]